MGHDVADPVVGDVPLRNLFRDAASSHLFDQPSEGLHAFLVTELLQLLPALFFFPLSRFLFLFEFAGCLFFLPLKLQILLFLLLLCFLFYSLIFRIALKQ